MEVRLFRLKNMYSKSCIRLVELFFEKKEGIRIRFVRMGEVEMEIPTEREEEIENDFRSLGFEVIHDPETETIEKIKFAAIELIHYAFNTNSLIRNSDYISEKLQMPYEKLSKIFSRCTSTTLEKYIIQLKVEKAKELIAQGDHTLSEISYMLGYSSVQYLSNQFKKVTGLTVSEFKEDPMAHRRPLEDIQ